MNLEKAKALLEKLEDAAHLTTERVSEIEDEILDKKDEILNLEREIEDLEDEISDLEDKLAKLKDVTEIIDQDSGEIAEFTGEFLGEEYHCSSDTNLSEITSKLEEAIESAEEFELNQTKLEF